VLENQQGRGPKIRKKGKPACESKRGGAEKEKRKKKNKTNQQAGENKTGGNKKVIFSERQGRLSQHVKGKRMHRG